MKVSPPEDEAARLKTLHEYGILDTPPEEVYDDIARLASHICGTPVAAVSFIDGERHWFKAKVGLDGPEIPRDASFCAHTILEPHELTVVPDARRDPRFENNPLVLGEPRVCFYAGAPLVAQDGAALGALCVIDREPRELSAAQRGALATLARQVMSLLELRRTVARLGESERRFEAFLDNGPAVAFVKDEAGRMVYVNKPFERRFGLTRRDWQGKDDFELWPEEAARAFREHDAAVLARNEITELVEGVPNPDGQTDYWQTYKFPLTYGGRRLLAGMAVDVTMTRRYEAQLEAQRRELERVNALLAEQSTTDPLTGLKNRRAFGERLEAEAERAKRDGGPLSLLMLDVDHFKSYNDAFGHPAGDEVLRRVAALLLGNTRSTDLVARYGGEEFVVVLPDTELEVALVLAERCRRAVGAAVWPERAVTVSLGVAALSREVASGDALVDVADRALYEAKRDGRNRVRGPWSPEPAPPPRA